MPTHGRPNKKDIEMIMQLLTPFMLASAPPTLPPQVGSVYDHSAQHSVGTHSGIKLAAGTFTSNGTRTYDYRGQPSDSDSDQD